MEQNKPTINIFRVLLKAGVLFALFNFAFIIVNARSLGKYSLYNSIFPGRERFPFGETRESYNLSPYNLDAMFASHILSGTKRMPNEVRVLLIGDSSVWGTLLTPEQTLADQLNANPITACGKTIHAYNLGYPTISLMKELLLLDQALEYQPDMIVWLTTLESFPLDKQFESPLVVNNAELVQQLIANYQLPYDPNDPALVQPSKWDQTFVGQRRALADLLRLQVYGVLWASTGIDQFYPENYERAQIDLEASEDFHGLDALQGNLALDVLDAGMSTGIPTLLVNEPILISNGQNSDIRYDFYYPRWAYDEYRTLLADHASNNNWNYIDLWDLVPMDEFTNSAVHLTPHGESLLTAQVAREIQNICK
jgi:hypothetical protein